MAQQTMIDPNLSRIISPQWAAVLVVDVQNDFCHERGALAHRGFNMKPVQSSVRALAQFVESARVSQVPVIFVATHHSRTTNSKSWLTRGPRQGGEICAVGSWGAEFYGLAPAAGEPIVIKNRYSGFVDTNLNLVLNASERRSLLVTGVSTNVCVESTVRDACMRDYYAVLVNDCCGAYTRAEHEATLHNVTSYFGWVVDSKTIIKYWAATPKRVTSQKVLA